MKDCKPFLNMIINEHKNYYTFAIIGEPNISDMKFLIDGIRKRNNHQPGVYDYWAIFSISEWYLQNLHSYVKQAKENKILDDIIRIMRPSIETVDLFRDRYFDMIYVDNIWSMGKEEINQWFTKLDKGKILCGSIYNKDIAHTCRALDILSIKVDVIGDIWYSVKEI